VYDCFWLSSELEEKLLPEQGKLQYKLGSMIEEIRVLRQRNTVLETVARKCDYLVKESERYKQEAVEAKSRSLIPLLAVCFVSYFYTTG
jgi:hypothetical protein